MIQNEVIAAPVAQNEEAAHVSTVSSELQDARRQLANREALQAKMKRINDAHKKYTKKPFDFDFTGFTEEERVKIVSYVPRYSWEPHPYAPYELTNNNANIRRYKERVAELEKKEAAQQESPIGETVTGNGWEVTQNNADDRIQISFDGKPEEAVRTELKRHGFKWAPSVPAWQRKITQNAQWTTKHYVIPFLQKAYPAAEA